MVESPTPPNIESDLPPIIKEHTPEYEAWKQQVILQEIEKQKSPFFYITNKVFQITYDLCRERDNNGELTGEFKPAMLAKWIAENEKFKTDYQTGILYFYDGKSWIPNAEPYLEKMVAQILKEENRVSHFTNILHDLRGLTYDKLEFSRKIACENGLLDPETQTFTDFNEKEMPLHHIPVVYDANAKYPHWEEFIKQIVNPDDLATIQEWSGFLLLPDYRFHKLLWVHGVGRNGKGVWQRTMENILGEKNISGIGLEELDGAHRFALKQLYGKLFNPCSEPTTNKILQTPLLKKATGQDTIEAEIKGKQQRLAFRNYAKITVLANKFPKVTDQTTAFRERRLFIKFPNEFTGDKQITNIEDNWLKNNDERSGILNWMLEGLKRLLEQGHFTESKSQQETEAEFLRHSDTIGAFLSEMCVFDKIRVTTRSDALEAYKNYCEILGLDPENEKKFTQRLKETPRISVTLVHKPKQERAWKGLGLKEINDEGEIKELDTDNTLDTHVYTRSIWENNLDRGESSTPVSSVSPVSNPEVVKDRFCGSDCGTFNKPSCPWFIQKVKSDNPIPLKCYGWTAPNPTSEEAF